MQLFKYFEEKPNNALDNFGSNMKTNETTAVNFKVLRFITYNVFSMENKLNATMIIVLLLSEFEPIKIHRRIKFLKALFFVNPYLLFSPKWGSYREYGVSKVVELSVLQLNEKKLFNEWNAT